MSRPAWVLAALSLVAVGCDGRTTLERSCDGEAIGSCEAYAWSVVDEGSITPSGIEIGDPMAMAQVRVRIRTCGAAASGPHQVRISGLAVRGGAPDGGSSEMLFPIATVGDDDRNGLIDEMIGNPFNGAFPAESDLQLRFEPFLGRCEGQTLAGVSYRTGPIWDASGP